MSRKKQQDEFVAMASVYETLRPFDADSRARMIDAVFAKLKAEQPKPRGPRKRANVVPIAPEAKAG